MSSLKQRTTLYSLVLAFAVVETAIAFTSGFMDGFARFLKFFGPITGGFSVLTWIWLSVLFICLVVIFLSCGIMLFTQAPANCNFSRSSDGFAATWCGMNVTAGGLAFLIAILSGSAALVIRRGTSDLSENVCAGDLRPGSVPLDDVHA